MLMKRSGPTDVHPHAGANLPQVLNRDQERLYKLIWQSALWRRRWPRQCSMSVTVDITAQQLYIPRDRIDGEV